MKTDQMASATLKIQSEEDIMEYIIFLTYRCNLRCSYCFANNVVDNENTTLCLSIDKTNQIIDFIRQDISNRKTQENSIVFFGGEPTLVPDLIDYIIEETSDLNLRYSIYTNGLLLKNMPEKILLKLNTILVAIDGDKQAHETYKPVGSYEKIIENVRYIRKDFPGELIARITMEENTDIFKSVTNLLNEFDFVHWQIVNKPFFKSPQALLDSYKKNIDKLCDFWIEALSNRIIYNIVPFNEIMAYLLSGIEENQKSFWCGCGKDVMAIDIQGNIYQCDEYINKPESKIATIEDMSVNLNYISHTSIFAECKNCNISAICLGRCRKSLETLSPEQLHTYCLLTRALVDKLEAKVDIVKKIIRHNQWGIDRFPHSVYNTEVIP